MDGHVPGVDFHADTLFPKRELTISNALIGKKGRLQIKILDEVLEYPVDWLRNNCHCKKCFNPYCLSYISSLKPIVFQTLKIKGVTMEQNVVEVTFNDDHKSKFSATWLYNRRMTPEGAKEIKLYLGLYSAKPWLDPENVVIKKATYQHVTETAEGLQYFAESLVVDGIFIIADSPEKYLYEEFGNKTGLKAVINHYGAQTIVKNEAKPINFAYTSGELELHVDEIYLISCPQIQLLHCLKQAEIGGENVMVDGIKAANVLRDRFPAHFKILSTMNIRADDLIALKDEDQFYQTNSTPVINLDQHGEPAFIRWTNPAHSSFFEGSPDDYETYMAALKEFYKILYECSIKVKTKPGDILVFDNQRVMHARLAFDSSQERELEVWYIEWDAVYSKLRLAMMNKLKK